MLLLLEDVKKAYREPDGTALPILDMPRFAVDAGEQMALIGRSGSGKTTLLHTIAGIRTIDSGSILLGDVDICRLSEQGRDRVRALKIGYVFQTFNLLPAFTAFENVLLGMTFSPKRTDRRRALDLLERVGLAHRSTHKPAALSVGEQQRVAVARALANRPALLLADEPTANVDPANQQQTVNLIRDSCSEDNIAMILVTHSMEVAGQFDRIDRLEDINHASNPIPPTIQKGAH
jgi:ABC-type lipoprotein export system ATPase subunit